MDETSQDETTLLYRDEENRNEDKFRVGFPSCRQVLAFMAFLGFVNVYCLRVNLSVALVAMVNSSYHQTKNLTGNECPGDNNTKPESNSTTEFTGEFNWDSNLQGIILGSFFYGYILTQVPGGWLAEIYGGKKLFGYGVLCTAVLTLLTPLAARLNIYLLITLRVLEGIGEGVTFPAVHAMLAKWAPPLERSKLGTFIYSGAQMGTVISSPVSGLLCQYGFAGGWPSVFYVFGTAGCVWFILWTLLCYDSPAVHPRISAQERQLIEKSIGNANSQKATTPWSSILTSLPVLALAVAHVSNNWGFYTLLTCLPTYMREVLHFDISANGFLSGLPYLVTWFTMAAGGTVADVLRKKGIMSTTTVRKVFNTTGQVLPAIFLVATGYLGCDRNLAVAMVTLSVGMSGLTMSGYGVNHLDVAPPFAGTLMGLTNGFATIPGIVGPLVVGALTNDNPTRGQWQIVFFIAAGSYLFGALVYIAFGSGEQQEWAKPRYSLIPTYDVSVSEVADISDGEEDNDSEKAVSSGNLQCQAY